MQKAALHARIGNLNEQVRTLELRCQARTIERDEAREKLALARAGLLIALPCIGPDPARLLVAVALEHSQV